MFGNFVYAALIIFTLTGCGRSQSGDPGTSNAVVSTLSPEEERTATANFHEALRGRWEAGCEKAQTGSQITYLRFDVENQGTRKLVTFSSAKCQGEIVSVKADTFSYRIQSFKELDGDPDSPSLMFGVFMVFDRPGEAPVLSQFEISEKQILWQSPSTAEPKILNKAAAGSSEL